MAIIRVIDQPATPPLPSQQWRISHRFDVAALPLADRHYNRRAVGSPQFCPPGRCLVLLHGNPPSALWVTSWPFAEFTRHRWAGAWVNSLFRSEDPYALSSDLIRLAVAITRGHAATEPSWSSQPEPHLGIVTFVDASKTRRKRDPGRCYRRAGFRHVGFTEGGLFAFQMLPGEMPPPVFLPGSQTELELLHTA